MIVRDAIFPDEKMSYVITTALNAHLISTRFFKAFFDYFMYFLLHSFRKFSEIVLSANICTFL